MGSRPPLILLDTHAWVWGLDAPQKLGASARRLIEKRTGSPLLVSIISCWEVAKLVEKGRLGLGLPVAEWIDRALAAPGIDLVELTPGIAVASTSLPPPFHADPADQIIVATARSLGATIVTSDAKILDYPHVRAIW